MPCALFASFAVFAVFAVWATGAAAADDDAAAMRRVSFQVESSREVANDQVRAAVGVTDEDADPAALASRVNSAMAWGLETARRAEGVRVESGGYQTYPVHEKGRIRRWRASQEMILESPDVEAVSALLGELQSRLELRSLDFSVSPERRREVEDGLVVEAIGAFKRRAKLVREQLDARSFEIVDLSIDTGGGVVVPRRRVGRVLMAEAAQVGPPYRN